MWPHFFTSDLIFRVRPVFQVWPFIKLKFLSSVTYFFQLWFIFSSVTYYFQVLLRFFRVLAIFTSVKYFLNGDPFLQVWPMLSILTHFESVIHFWKCDPFLKEWPSFVTDLFFIRFPPLVYTEEATQQSEVASTAEKDLFIHIHSYILYLMSRLVKPTMRIYNIKISI